MVWYMFVCQKAGPLIIASTGCMEYLHQATKGKDINSYQLLAGIAAEHCLANDFESTNWESIYRQYLILEKLDKNPIVQFNRCIAQYYAQDKENALTNLLHLQEHVALNNSSQYHTALGVFYEGLNKKVKSTEHFQIALTLSKSTKEKQLILQRMNT